MVKRFITTRSNSVLSAAMIMAVVGLGSRLLGVLRERLLSARFGVGPEMDAYAAAFRIPDTLFALFVVGAIATAFIPVLADALFGKNAADSQNPPLLNTRPEALNIAVSILNSITLVIGILAIGAFFLAPQLVGLIAPGFDYERHDLTVVLLRLMLLQPIILGASTVIGAVLQTYRHFVAFALAPVFYNLGIILGLVILVPLLGVLGLAWGVLLGAVLHLLVQLPALKATKFKWQPIWRWTAAEAKILKLMIPRTIGIAGENLSLLVLTALASTMAQGTNALLYYADNIRALPMGIIGVAFSVAAFPLLSAKAAQANLKDFSASLMASVRQVLFWVIPLTVALYLLRAHLVRLVIGTHQLTWDPTILAIAMVGAFTFTIIFQALVPLLAKAFYAFKNTWLPVTAAIFGSGLTAGSAFWFAAELKARLPWTLILADILRVPQMPDLTPLALPLALGAGVVLQVIILVTALKIKLAKIDGIWTFFQSIIKTITATVAMAIALYLTRNFLAPLATDPDLRTTVGLFFQASFAAIAGAAAFVLVSWGLESKELQELKRILPWTKKSIDPAQEK